jgi:hypothetical protein
MYRGIEPIVLIELRPGEEFECSMKGVLAVGELDAIFNASNTYYEEITNDHYIFKIESSGQLSEYELFKSLNITKIKDLIYFLNNYIDEIEQNPALEFAYMVLNSENNNKNGLLEGPCNLNGCKPVIYKPNNSTFAQEGAVTGSARLLQLNVKTIANSKELKWDYTSPIIYKNKAPGCNPAYFRKNGNPKTCFKNSNDTTTIS